MTKLIKILRTHLHITLRNILESVIVEVKKVGESLSICLMTSCVCSGTKQTQASVAIHWMPAVIESDQ